MSQRSVSILTRLHGAILATAVLSGCGDPEVKPPANLTVIGNRPSTFGGRSLIFGNRP